jgi:hypothetical protein
MLNPTLTAELTRSRHADLLTEAARHRNRRLARRAGLRAEGQRTCLPDLLRVTLARTAPTAVM